MPLSKSILKCSNIGSPKTIISFDPYDIADFKLTRPKNVPSAIQDEDMRILWEWSVLKKSVRELGIHPMQLNRKVRKFVKQMLEERFSKHS